MKGRPTLGTSLDNAIRLSLGSRVERVSTIKENGTW